MYSCSWCVSMYEPQYMFVCLSISVYLSRAKKERKKKRKEKKRMKEKLTSNPMKGLKGGWGRCAFSSGVCCRWLSTKSQDFECSQTSKPSSPHFGDSHKTVFWLTFPSSRTMTRLPYCQSLEYADCNSCSESTSLILLLISSYLKW